MHRPKRISIINLNQQLTCKLCKGYFIDATTIVECLHTFCRSCIVQYLEKNKYCPVCDVQVHKSKPLLNIRADKTIQDIVYKLVPRLFHNEIQRRLDFYDNHPENKPTNADLYNDGCYQHILTPEEPLCVTFNYHGCKEMTRYLRCPAAVSIGHLKKLIQAKYDLTDDQHVDILYNQDCLNSSLTLMDISYIYTWKRKTPIELSYKIYERQTKKTKVESGSTTDPKQRNNNWKEVQLRISENGEMSITGIQDSSDTLNLVNNLDSYKPEIVTVVDSKCTKPNLSDCNKREVPSLKYIGKSTICTSSCATSISRTQSTTYTSNSESVKPSECDIKPEKEVLAKNVSESNMHLIFPKLPAETGGFSTACASLSSATTTTVYSTINSTKCCATADNTLKEKICDKKNIVEIKQDITFIPVTSETQNFSLSSLQGKVMKRKNENNTETEKDVLPPKLPKPTILNHSIGLLNLSNNHPLKKHSKFNRNGESVIEKSVEIEKNTVTTSKLEEITTSSKNNIQISRPSTPMTQPKAVGKFTTTNHPCYMPKTNYNPVINIPKPTTSTANAKNETKSVLPQKDVKSTNSTISRTDVRMLTSSTNTVSNSFNNKTNIKSKASTPIGYKTLRDPPKSWNSQISKANVMKPVPDPRYSDSKNVRPAKFFKMRNNMPRYLGNPASGVKPMYQVQVSPEKNKQSDTKQVEKSEIKKHSIVKIDPKTLKPISEKAPETTSLSNQSDLKINTSSVSIFNPLKLQSSSPKNDRKSPKSPSSPKTTKNNNSPSSKRDKVNLNFTPSNPFIPNLASPTLNPNQFLYPTGPAGFPTYDPRVMAAYHSLWYGQRMGFPSTISGLSLDLNQQRKSFDIITPTSPKLLVSQSSPTNSQQMSSKVLISCTAPQSPIASTSTTLQQTHLFNCQPSTASSKLVTSPAIKKPIKEVKSEKRLENAVEKLTQNRTKELENTKTIPLPKILDQPKINKGAHENVEETISKSNTKDNSNNTSNGSNSINFGTTAIVMDKQCDETSKLEDENFKQRVGDSDASNNSESNRTSEQTDNQFQSTAQVHSSAISSNISTPSKGIQSIDQSNNKTIVNSATENTAAILKITNTTVNSDSVVVKEPSAGTNTNNSDTSIEIEEGK